MAGRLISGDKSMAAPEIKVRAATTITPSRDGTNRKRGPFHLEVRGGEFLAILGPAGSGKSTILKLIAGLLRLTSGQIQIAGDPWSPVHPGIGFVFARPYLMPWRTVLQNVLLQAEIRGLDGRKSREQAYTLLTMLGLNGEGDRMPHELPPAAAVRTGMCRALVHNPTLLLLDDPFRSLDPLNREQIAADLQRLSLNPRMTVLLATCLPAEAVQLADRVAVMAPDGTVQQYLSIELPRPRRLDKATTPQIAEYCNSIRLLLHAHGVLV
jgi:NitT/TauT family transport system ATP-binding protein